MSLQATTTAPASLPDALRLGAVHLDVADLDRAVAWYQRSLGLIVHAATPDRAELGDPDHVVVVLHHDPQAKPAGRHAGLYHYALLYAERDELARAALRLAAARTPIQGASDHRTHEAIYLADVDGNGIELAWDRPREQWPSGLGYDGAPAPLDFDDLLNGVVEQAPPATVAAGLAVGHLHLHVGDVADGLAFYRDVVGFALQANLGSAAFVSAGGYHHHLGFNVWNGHGVTAAPDHSGGLRRWNVELPTHADVEAVRARLRAAGLPFVDTDAGLDVQDPWGTTMRLQAAA